jgi:hypothetical protein
MTNQDTTRKNRKEQRKRDDDLTPLLPAVVLPVLIDAPPATASTPTPAADPALSWDSGFSGGDSGGGGGGGDF